MTTADGRVMRRIRAEWTASTGFTRFIEGLERAGCRVEGGGRQRRAQCPHHPDAKPSLGITDSMSRVPLICRRGCETVDILADLGTPGCPAVHPVRSVISQAGRRIP